MSKLKRYFVLPYLFLVLLAAIHSTSALFIDPAHRLAWLGALIALLPMLAFMGGLALVGRARTQRHLVLQLTCAAIGTLLVLYQPHALALAYAVLLGLVGVSLYDFWYSELGRRPSSVLELGAVIPEFPLVDSKGQEISSASFAGRPAIYLFIRGNWCPLCVAQVKELAAEYRRLEARGVQVVAIAGQPLAETQQLAKRFDVPMVFCSDVGNRAAKQLGIEHLGGVPAGMPGFDADTILPTVVIVDSEGRILYADQTVNYRVRPSPEAFLRVLDERGTSLRP